MSYFLVLSDGPDEDKNANNFASTPRTSDTKNKRGLRPRPRILSDSYCSQRKIASLPVTDEPWLFALVACCFYPLPEARRKQHTRTRCN